MRKSILTSITLLFFAFLSGNAIAQNISRQIDFAKYLVDQEYFNESLYETNQLLKKGLSRSRKDSVLYLKGWSLYNQKRLKQSGDVLIQVHQTSPFYEKACLFGAYNFIHSNDFQKANQTIQQFAPSSKEGKDFSLFLRSGMELLKRDITSYQEIREDLPTDYYGFSSELKELDDIANDLAARNPKSPALAGVFSGIVPGSGQIYSGKTGQGIAAFLMSAGLGLVTWENYEKRGPREFETIFFASAFSVFYVGNIYGAVFSAKLANNQYNELTDKQILFNIHIPLRNIFD
ncbi:MAG: hypothetical protein ACQEQ0_07710 [Bacteroidota bacterium]